MWSLQCLVVNVSLQSAEHSLSEVLKLGSSTRINEKCLELQKNKKDKASKMKVYRCFIDLLHIILHTF